MTDPGSWNVRGILANAKKAGQSPYGATFKKHKNYKPKGAALALSKKLLAEKKSGNDK